MTSATGALACEVKAGAHHVALSGALTMENVGALYRSLKPLMGAGSLTLDASAVTKADSSALALITTIARMARERKMQVVLKPLPPALSSILEIYGLQDLFAP
jgi:anti-anti-sigma factor